LLPVCDIFGWNQSFLAKSDKKFVFGKPQKAFSLQYLTWSFTNKKSKTISKKKSLVPWVFF
jgi:hypothetical protein